MDRNRNKVIDIAVTKSRDKSAYIRIAIGLERRGYRIDLMCTDGYEGYSSYKLAKKHVVTKSETALVESKNSLIRHYLARFNRKTKRFSKSLDMIYYSILILFNKNLLLSIFT